ncbi:MAG TPA: oligosaccharide flippase family protein, partial [Blastocatellia bacterium]|nr:oligosaccharide flippase family protein [Blastocatellia bacterium]
MSLSTGEATAARAPENLSTSGSTICEETTTGSTAPPMSSGGAEKVAGNIFSLASGELLSRAIAFLATAYLARKLDPAGFGIIGFAAAFYTYFYFAGAI